MVEFLMIFALGALTAIFAGLLMLPALNARAQRLQRRKLEALYPMSIAEITAERDHVRAAMAVESRRAEVRASATAHDKAADLAEIGKRDVRIHALGETVAARDAAITGLETDLSTTRAMLADTEAVRDRLSADLAATRTDLAQRTAAHSKLQDRFDRTDADLSQTRQDLLMTQSTLVATQADLTARSEAHAALSVAHQSAVALADERKLVIATLETRMETLRLDRDDTARRLGEAQARVATLETLLQAADDTAREANAAVAENAGKLEEARAALMRLETRQLAQQRAIDAARQQARSERNAAQAASLALVKAEAELKRIEAKGKSSSGKSSSGAPIVSQRPANDQPLSETAAKAVATPVTPARIARMTKDKPRKLPTPDAPKEAAE